MNRKLDAKHPIEEVLARRWSPRAFSPRIVEQEKLQSLLEAARWAPSSFNEQPWAFLIAASSNPEEYARMLSCISENNQRWARTAPVLMLSVASLKFKLNQKPNRHAFHDVGLSVANLVVEATALGLYVHQMAGFSPDTARTLYAIPDDWEAVAAIALGYLGDSEILPDDLKAREAKPSGRKPMQDFVFSGHWGLSAPWAVD